MGRRWVESGGVRLAVYEEGPVDGVPVLLVHGYPDNASVWDGVVPELAPRFRVVRYDVRGAGESGAPASRDGYLIRHLVEDLVAVVRSLGDRPVHLVGHDWGSIQAWAAVGDPSLRGLFASYTSISGPDLDHLGGWMRRAPKLRVLRQLLHSWYIGAFQVPLVPELVWRAPRLLRKFHARYRDARNGIELYRANMAGRLSRPGGRRVDIPVQQLALTRDPFVTPAILEAADPWCARLWRRPVAAGHWVVRDKPPLAARMIAEFVEHVGGSSPSRELARAVVGARRTAFEGRLALVTGAGRGIGRTTARALAAEGAEVLCVDVDFDAASRTAGEVGGAAFQLDVADGTATRRVADHILAEHGVPDVVVANAGVAAVGPFLETSVEDWQRVLDVNLWGVIHTLRAFLPPLVDRGEGGHVVVMSSSAGYLPLPSLPAYGTSKAGVLMLAQCLSGEMAGHGIGVSAICPGVVHTDITKTTRIAGLSGQDEEAEQARLTKLFRRRGFEPERVAVAVVGAVRDNRMVVPVTPEAKLGVLGNRVSPVLTRAILAAVNRRGVT